MGEPLKDRIRSASNLEIGIRGICMWSELVVIGSTWQRWKDACVRRAVWLIAPMHHPLKEHA